MTKHVARLVEHLAEGHRDQLKVRIDPVALVCGQGR